MKWVDTSSWIEDLRGRNNPVAERVRDWMREDEAALCEALRSGHLRAAGLDVFEKEPLSLESPLLKLDNLLVCGHLAGLDEESRHDTLQMSAQTIIDLHEGRWPIECIRNLNGIRDWKW